VRSAGNRQNPRKDVGVRQANVVGHGSSVSHAEQEHAVGIHLKTAAQIPEHLEYGGMFLGRKTVPLARFPAPAGATSK